jgi:hypothetical protein
MLNVCSLDGGQSRVEIVAKHKPKKKKKKGKKESSIRTDASHVGVDQLE